MDLPEDEKRKKPYVLHIVCCTSGTYKRRDAVYSRKYRFTSLIGSEKSIGTPNDPPTIPILNLASETDVYHHTATYVPLIGSSFLFPDVTLVSISALSPTPDP